MARHLRGTLTVMSSYILSVLVRYLNVCVMSRLFVLYRATIHICCCKEKTVYTWTQKRVCHSSQPRRGQARHPHRRQRSSAINSGMWCICHTIISYTTGQSGWDSSSYWVKFVGMVYPDLHGQHRSPLYYPDTSRSCKTMDIRPVYCVVWPFIPQLSLVNNPGGMACWVGISTQ